MNVLQLIELLKQYPYDWPVKVQVQYEQETPTGILENKWDELDLDNVEVLGTDKESTFLSIPLKSIV